MKLKRSKEWWLERARREGDCFVGAGREALIQDHARLSKPIWNLMFKALAALGYDK